MESEQLQNFNERLSQWVSAQGFWFQLRYSMSGSGSGGNVVFQLLNLAARVSVFLLVVAVGVSIYLVRRSGTEGYREEVRESLKSGLHASELELHGLRIEQGEMGISRLAAEGGNGTFFSALEARNVRCKMSFFDGLVGNWDPGTLLISRLEMDLRAGADDDESASQLADSLFGHASSQKLKAVEVADATLYWGYGRSIAPKSLSLADPVSALPQEFEFEHTRGSIRNSFMRIRRIGDELRLTLRGGKFSQNWLHDLEIVEMEVVCNRAGIRFEKARFRRLEGTVDFSGLTVAGGARPRIDGTVVIRNLPLGVVLPPVVKTFLEGSISGDFQVSGSTNSSEGITYEGGVTLATPDMISLGEQLQLLQALSVVDFSRNYHRVEFREGSFHLKISGGGLELTDMHLKSDDPITLDGKLNVRLPTYEEMVEFRNVGSAIGSASRYDLGDGELEASDDDSDNLSREANESNRSREDEATPSATRPFSRVVEGLSKQRFSHQASEMLNQTLHYQGEFTIGLPPDAFERAPRLAAKYPVDSTNHRIPVKVPVEGRISEITLEQAEAILSDGRR